MKKIIIWIFAIAIMMPTRMFAQEQNKELTPPEEMSKIMQCTSVNMSLSRVYMQIAASMIVLSAPQSATMKPMIKSYITLSQNTENKIILLSNVAQQIFIPQLIAHGQTKEEITVISSKLLVKFLTDINQNLNNPSFNIDERTAMLRALIAVSNECENHFDKIMDNHVL